MLQQSVPVSTPDDEFQAVMRENTRKWIASQMIRYSHIFLKYQKFKESGKPTAVTVASQMTPKPLREFFHNRKNSSVITASYRNPKASNRPPTQNEIDTPSLDQQLPSLIESKHKRYLKDNTPLLKKAQKQMDQLDDFLVPLMLMRNSEAATTAASEESVIVPFVESKRPEVIIRKQQ